MKVAVQKVCWH